MVVMVHMCSFLCTYLLETLIVTSRMPKNGKAGATFRNKSGKMVKQLQLSGINMMNNEAPKQARR